MTATEMIPAVGMTVLVRFEDCQVSCTVADVKHVYGKARVLITPVNGLGSQWVELSRVSIRVSAMAVTA